MSPDEFDDTEMSITFLDLFVMTRRHVSIAMDRMNIFCIGTMICSCDHATTVAVIGIDSPSLLYPPICNNT